MNLCEQAGPELSPQEMAALIKTAPPGPWPERWADWENVRDAHLLLLGEAIDELPPYPGCSSSRGIVVCVNAKPGWSSGKNLKHGYFPGAYVLVKELRRLGCTLPIVFAYLGPLELDWNIARLVKPLGVECLDLRECERSDPMRILAGWEAKVYAIQHAPFQEVLYLDADNVPVRNPTFLFDTPQYQQTGAVFWPDLPPCDREQWLPEVAWTNLGMDFRNEVDFESGQLLVDKHRCWRELMLCRHINEHSDYYYRFIFGDKSTFHLAWAKLNTDWALPAVPAGWEHKAILQYDFAGSLLFQHACQDKPSLGGYSGRGYLVHEAQCDAHLAELRQLWHGKLWHNEMPTAEELRLARELCGRTFLYERKGLDSRRLCLLKDHRVGLGLRRCETSWSVFASEGRVLLALSSIDDVPTALLERQADGSWRGRWLEHERCECSLTPVER